jgi:hypothetical protein
LESRHYGPLGTNETVAWLQSGPFGIKVMELEAFGDVLAREMAGKRNLNWMVSVCWWTGIPKSRTTGQYICFPAVKFSRHTNAQVSVDQQPA